MICNAADSVLVLIDLQPTFMAGMPDGPLVVHRNRFLVECATLLKVPILVTEQYSSRMGGTDPLLLDVLGKTKRIDKMSFSAMGCEPFIDALNKHGRGQVILTGIETHICVMQTCLHLLEQEIEVAVVHDAVTGRGEDATAKAFQRMRHAGASVVHSESVTYEWMESAEHPQFKDVLKLVKQYSAE